MIKVLGPLEVDADGPLDVGSPRHREVLAALVVDAGRVVSTEALLERVWGEGARGATTANLHAVISRLRGRLRSGHQGVEITTVAPGYRLDAPPGAIDARVFQDRFAAARAARADGDLGRARALVGQALDLWRGTAYADIRHPFAEAEAARLDGQRLAALELAAELDLAQGHHEPVAERLPQLVAEHPLREAFRAQLMLALYRCGRQADALAAYADVRDVLAEELGLDPGPELQELHQRILEQDERLLADAERLPPAPAQPGPTTPADLRSEVVVPTNVLLGRERDVEYVRDLLAESDQRLVTLTGVGGVGKTRLAYAVAEAARPGYRDGVAIVSLAPLTDPAMVLPAIGRATGLAAVEGLDPVAAVAAHLRNLQVLVVLDNAEHLLDAAAGLSRLVASCPGVTVLVTSRTTLRVRGELQYQVQPLPLPEPGETEPSIVADAAAVTLFVERAQAVAPSFELGHDNAAAVAAICRRLSGIPLALELAAARTRLLPPSVILARLEEVMAGAGARDLPPRQRTMRAAIDWSYELLDVDEQRLFRWLSVFTGGFTLDAAEKIAAEPGDRGVLTLVESLVEQSLVLVDHECDEPRFRMLEPVLQYAWTRMADEEAATVRRAHLRHYLELAQATEPAYRGPGTIEALALTEREHGNLVSAMEWGLEDGRADLSGRLGWALWLFWWLRGHLLEGRRLMEAVLAREVPDDVRVRALAVLGAMTFAQGDIKAARCWSDGARLAAETGDREGESHCVAGEGLVALAEGDLDEAERAMRATIPLCEATVGAGMWLWTLAHVWLGTICLLRDQPEEALPLLDRALAAGRERNDRLAIYIALFTASQVALRLGDPGRARQQLEEGIRLSEDTGDMANLAYFLESLAVVESIDGRPRRVATLHGTAQRLRETVGANVYGYYQPDEQLLADALAGARTGLGEVEYAAAVAAGRGLDVPSVIAYATGGADRPA